MRSQLKKIINNTAWLFADKFLRVGLGLVIGIWLARYLGPEEFGLYNYALAYVGLLGILASLGLDKVVVRDVVHEPGSRNEVLGTAFFLKITSGLTAYILAIIAITLTRLDNPIAVWLVAIMALRFIFQAFDVVDLWFQSQIQSKYTVYARNTAFIFVALIKVLLILYGASLIAFAWATLVEAVFAALGLYLAYRFTHQECREWKLHFPRVKTLIKECWPLAVSSLAVMAYMKIDQIMIGGMINDAAVGIYSAAVWISEAWYFLPVIIVSSLLPILVRNRELDRRLYLNRLQSLYRLMFWLGFSVALITTLLANKIVSLLYGQAYVESANILIIHVWAAIAVFLGVGSSQYLLAEKLQRISLYRTLIGLTINVALNWILIPRYGADGAAMATLISYNVATFSLILFRQTRGQTKLFLYAINPFPLVPARR